jgi:hypothetical protein
LNFTPPGLQSHLQAWFGCSREKGYEINIFMGVIGNIAATVAWIERDAKNGSWSAPEECRQALWITRGNPMGDHGNLTAKNGQ